MKNDIRLTAQDIQVRQENALGLYYSGIKTKQTRQIMTRNLKKFLVDACAELLEGTLEQRAQQFVDIASQKVGSVDKYSFLARGFFLLILGFAFQIIGNFLSD